MNKRQFLLGAAALSALTLSGCGFHLRGRFVAPFETLYLQMRENTPLSTEIARAVQAESDIRIVNSPNEADAILELLRDSRNRDVLSINDAGQAREYELTKTLEFRVTSPDGYVFLKPTRLVATRSLPYSDADFLSRHNEENLLYRDMDSDMVKQLMRYLAAITPRPERRVQSR